MDKNKREAIEKAVVELGGVFDVVSDNSHSGSDCLYVWSDGEYVNLVYGMEQCTCKLVCTRAEFEQVKAELYRLYRWRLQTAPHRYFSFEDWLTDEVAITTAKIRAEATGFDWRTTLEERPEPTEQPMKYEYGVEYECNGEKPDLPSDVEINWYSRDTSRWMLGDDDPTTVGELHDWGGVNAYHVTKFRIVDERYKPQSKWHTRGELPPVGEVCETSLSFHGDRRDNNWNKIEVLYTDESTVVGRVIEGSHSHRYSNGFETHIYEFRPIRPERDELIEIIESVGNQSNGFLDDTIIDKGWRPTK